MLDTKVYQPQCTMHVTHAWTNFMQDGQLLFTNVIIPSLECFWMKTMIPGDNLKHYFNGLPEFFPKPRKHGAEDWNYLWYFTQQNNAMEASTS